MYGTGKRRKEDERRKRQKIRERERETPWDLFLLPYDFKYEERDAEGGASVSPGVRTDEEGEKQEAVLIVDEAVLLPFWYVELILCIFLSFQALIHPYPCKERCVYPASCLSTFIYSKDIELLVDACLDARPPLFIAMKKKSWLLSRHEETPLRVASSPQHPRLYRNCTFSRPQICMHSVRTGVGGCRACLLLSRDAKRVSSSYRGKSIADCGRQEMKRKEEEREACPSGGGLLPLEKGWRCVEERED